MSSSRMVTSHPVRYLGRTRSRFRPKSSITRQDREAISDKLEQEAGCSPRFDTLTKRHQKEDSVEDLGDPSLAPRPSKAEVMSKATEYIRHLVNENENLSQESASLQSRVEAFEILTRSPNFLSKSTTLDCTICEDKGWIENSSGNRRSVSTITLQ
ncbi:hypothetical protein B0J14DRAFT_582376 [Halenospora varia]|nr:hypothetical protein B0J14DRAFT_582376 [Halenospora varia]